jgi:hypothetical protein
MSFSNLRTLESFQSYKVHSSYSKKGESYSEKYKYSRLKNLPGEKNLSRNDGRKLNYFILQVFRVL